jgi:hypothetical protein
LISVAGFLESASYRFRPMGSISMHLFRKTFSWPQCQALCLATYWAGLVAAPVMGASDPTLSLTNRVAFTRQHVDIRTVFQADAETPITLKIHDGDRGINYPATNTVLMVAERAKLAIPAGFETFGPEGSPLWVLPQSQDPALVYLGFSAEGFPRDLFDGRLRLNLKEVRGPGSVFLWQADSAGGVTLRINSKDGLDADDRIEPLINGHDHYNLGFTTAGLYELVFQPSARPLGSETFLLGESVPVLFAVEPLPVVPPPPPLWHQWVQTQWPGGVPNDEIQPEADPDHDGEPNVAEFLSGTNPRDPSSRPRLKYSPGTGLVPSLVFELPVLTERVSQAQVELESATTLTGPWTPLPSLAPIGAFLRWEDSFATLPNTRFYRQRTTKL